MVTLRFAVLAAMLAGFGAGGGRVARADDAPALKDWIKRPRKNGGAFPRRIAFVSGFGEKGEAPRFLALVGEDFEKVSYLRAADARSALWDLKLNKKLFEETDPQDLVFTLTGADAVLVAPDKGDWELLRKDGDRIATVVKRRGLKKPTPAAVADWLVTALGWDGVVLDRTAEYLLVGSTASILKTPEIQALAVSDTADKIVLKADERKGAGLLSVSESDGGFGVFDVVFLGQGVKSIPPGTKLIIERASK